jgi:hypothetical protein
MSWLATLQDRLDDVRCQTRHSEHLAYAIAFDILWVGCAVFAPVVLIALSPSLLGPSLVVLVVGISLKLETLPLPSARALAFRR